jgi:hypothetical protein
LPELVDARLKPGKEAQYQAKSSADERLFPASFGGIIHVAFLGHDCQIKQAERDDNDGYD